MTPSSSSKLSLGNVSLITSGSFTCVVTGGDIPFQEDYDTKYVTVAGEEKEMLWKMFVEYVFSVPPDKRPEIEGVPATFSPGDFLSLNCTTANVG